MKAENLQILRENGIRVPDFIVVREGQAPDLSFSDARSFAVRSSFALEDDDENSFAGQFKTLLNVEREAVEAAVSEVRESYTGRLYKNIQVGSISSPVIIQEMVMSDISGVIFTANPLGILNEAVITAGYGLGEDIVSDRAETVTYYYNRDDMRFYLREKSGVSLDAALLRELIAVSTEIRELFGKEMDIEFAVKEGSVFILQARPITTLPETPAENVLILDNSNIVESYPGICLPATHDFVHDVYRDIFKSCVHRITRSDRLVEEMEDIFDHMVVSYGGSIYYQLNSWYEILQLLPFSDRIIRIWQESLGVQNRAVSKSSRRVGRLVKLKILAAFFYYLAVTPASMRKLNRYFDLVYPEFKGKIEDTDTAEELLKLLYEIENAITSVWDITLVNDMYTFLFTALSGGKKNERIASIRDLESMKPMLARRELRKAVREFGIDSQNYQEKEREYIETYGDRVFGELKLETRTYRTDPELLRKQILSEEDVQRQETTCRRSLSPFVRAAKRGIANRERSRLHRSRLFGLAREILLKIGGLMVQNGQIDRREDIFYLYLREMKGSLRRKELIDRRKEQFRLYAAAPHPGRLVFGSGMIEEQRLNCEEQFADVAVLQGIPTSPGRATGEAIVIREAVPGLDVKGKILVTRSTDPGWVFLLEKCSGIIAEQGSVLSHTAIISRELGKPAIVNVKDATNVIRTGDQIELDADTGTVRILQRVE